MLPSAVLLDFDGVLADTANVHVAAWQRTFRAMGWVETDETCARAAEVDDRAFVAEVFARRKIEGGDVEGWVRRKRELTARLLADGVRPVGGVAGLVRNLRGRTRLAVVSTASREDIAGVLGRAGLLDAFEVVVAREDVGATKPDPEAYLVALGRLGLDPAAAIAVEDSATGVAAAERAGVPVVVVGAAGSSRVGDRPVLDRDDPAALEQALRHPN